MRFHGGRRYEAGKEGPVALVSDPSYYVTGYYTEYGSMLLDLITE